MAANILIVFYLMIRNTRRIAEELRDAFGAGLADIEEIVEPAAFRGADSRSCEERPLCLTRSNTGMKVGGWRICDPRARVLAQRTSHHLHHHAQLPVLPSIEALCSHSIP